MSVLVSMPLLAAVAITGALIRRHTSTRTTTGDAIPPARWTTTPSQHFTFQERP